MKVSKGITKTRLRTTLADVYGFKFRTNDEMRLTEVYNYDNEIIMLLHNTQLELNSNHLKLKICYSSIDKVDFRFSRPFMFCRVWMKDGQSLDMYLDVVGDYEKENEE